MEWWSRFGPASGSDPKLKDPFGRYVLTTFVGGINMTFAEAARHIAGVSAHELSAITNRHLGVDKINEAITDVVNAFMRLDLVKAWGDGTSVAADGTQMGTFIDNLIAESSIRTEDSAGSHTTTYRISTSRSSPDSFPAAYGRPSTSSTGC
nr:Tn3 family transposase [Streptomyces sp. NRRL F-2664]